MTENNSKDCSCMVCQMCHGHEHHHRAARLIVKIIVLALVFMAGVMIGTVHGEHHSWERGYGMMRGGYYEGAGMMRGGGYAVPSQQGAAPVQGSQGAGAPAQSAPVNSQNQ